MKRFVFVCLLLMMTQAHADSGIERLQTFSSQLKTLRANFVQSLYDQQQKVVQTTEGSVLLQRPGRFRWDYQKPYLQQIISDGANLWIYDTDLAQVTVKPFDNALGAAPIGLLSENRPLAEDFNLKELGPRENLLWVELEPKVKDTDFTIIYLGMDEAGMRVMELRDTFGQVTQIQFKDTQLNTDIAADTFMFVPPAGVDVIGTP